MIKNTLFTLLFTFSFLPVSHADFSDVTKTTKYKEAIEYLTENGIVNGYPDGTFKPENTLNRAELLKILIEATVEDFPPSQGGIEGGEYTNCFPDITTEWYAPYVCYAKEKGIVNGYPDGTFKPEQTISFVEAAKIIVNAMELETGEETDVWYENYAKALTENKRVPRTVTSFEHLVTRGEMAEMVWRVMEDYKEAGSWMDYAEMGANLPEGNLFGDELGSKGTTYITGYAEVITQNANFCEENCTKFDVVHFFILARSNDQKFTTMGDKGNFYINNDRVVIGCYKDSQIYFLSSSVSGGGKLNQKLSSLIINSTPSSPITLKFTTENIESGGGTPNCYSYFSEITIF